MARKLTKKLVNYWNDLFQNNSNKSEDLINLKYILLNGKDTNDSIKLFLELKKDFEDILNERKFKAIAEKNIIDSYDQKKPSLGYSTVKDDVFNHPIKNENYAVSR